MKDLFLVLGCFLLIIVTVFIVRNTKKIQAPKPIVQKPVEVAPQVIENKPVVEAPVKTNLNSPAPKHLVKHQHKFYHHHVKHFKIIHIVKQYKGFSSCARLSDCNYYMHL